MRTVTEAFETALSEGTLRPRYFFELETSGSPLRYWTGSKDISWDSHTWLGGGVLQNIARYDETSDVEADGREVTLAGEPSAILSLLLNNLQQNKAAKIWFALLDDDQAVVADPFLEFSGQLDETELVDGPDGASLKLSLENTQVDADRKRELRYTHEIQAQMYPGDLGLEYTPQMEKWQGYWGRKQPRKTSRKNSHKSRKTK